MVDLVMKRYDEMLVKRLLMLTLVKICFYQQPVYDSSRILDERTILKYLWNKIKYLLGNPIFYSKQEINYL